MGHGTPWVLGAGGSSWAVPGGSQGIMRPAGTSGKCEKHECEDGVL